MEFTVAQGDISAETADVLVNAANTHLVMGAGVAGALRRAGGEALNDAAVAQGPIDLGAVAVTDGYGLDASYVIHAATMPPSGRATEQSIRDSVRNSLAAADERGCESLVIPALGCGVAGFSLEDGARIICEELAAYVPTSLRDVRFITYGDDEFETVRRVVDAVRAGR